MGNTTHDVTYDASGASKRQQAAEQKRFEYLEKRIQTKNEALTELFPIQSSVIGDTINS